MGMVPLAGPAAAAAPPDAGPVSEPSGVAAAPTAAAAAAMVVGRLPDTSSAYVAAEGHVSRPGAVRPPVLPRAHLPRAHLDREAVKGHDGSGRVERCVEAVGEVVEEAVGAGRKLGILQCSAAKKGKGAGRERTCSAGE